MVGSTSQYLLRLQPQCQRLLSQHQRRPLLLRLLLHQHLQQRSILETGGRDLTVRAGQQKMAASQDYTATTVMGSIALKKCNMRPSPCRLIAMMPIGGVPSIIRVGRNALQAKHWRAFIATIVTASIALKK